MLILLNYVPFMCSEIFVFTLKILKIKSTSLLIGEVKIVLKNNGLLLLVLPCV